MYKFFVGIVAILFLTVLPGCDSGNPFSSRPFVIAVFVAPGQDDSGSVNILRGARFAIDFYNKFHADFSKQKISFVLVPIEVDEYSPESIANAVDMAISKYNAHVLIGGMASQQAAVIAEIAREKKIPFISPMATSHAIAEHSSFSFSNAPSLAFQVEAAVYYALQDLNAGTMGLLYNIYDSLSVDRMTALNRTFRSFGGDEVLVQSFSDNMEFYQSALSVLQRSPEIIFLTSLEPPLVEQIQTLHSMGFRGKIFTLSSQYVVSNSEDIGSIGLPVIAVTPWHSGYDGKANVEFVKNFKLEFGYEPSIADAMIHDAFLRLFTSVAHINNITREGVQAALAKMESMEGVAGNYLFLPTRTLKTMWVIEIQDGGNVRVVRALQPQ